MAFFGLTALGPDRLLAVGRDRVQHLHVFDDADWTAAWERHRRRLKRSKQEAEDAGLPLDALPAIMETVYHGPVPAPDVALLEGWVRKIVGEAATISKGAFMEAVRAARQEAEAIHRRRHHQPSTNNNEAKKLGPRDKYSTPLTALQEIGWEAASHVPRPPSAGRQSSEESKFVSALLQHRMYYIG